MYKIQVRVFLFFWETYKAKRHWFETNLCGVAIPPRLCIELQNGDIVVIANILVRDWRLNGIPRTTNQRVGPASSPGTTTDNDQSVLQPDDGARRGIAQQAVAANAEEGRV